MRNEFLNFLNTRNKIFLTIIKSFIFLVLYAEILKKLKKEILHYLCCDGICQNYIIWTWHGEVDKKQNTSSQRHAVDVDMYDWLKYMIYDIGDFSFRKSHIYDILCSDKDVSLYNRYISFTRFYVVLKLFNLKAKNGWTDKSFT